MAKTSETKKKWTAKTLEQFIGCLTSFDYDGFLVIYSKVKVVSALNGRGPEGIFIGVSKDKNVGWISLRGSHIDSEINIKFIRVV